MTRRKEPPDVHPEEADPGETAANPDTNRTSEAAADPCVGAAEKPGAAMRQSGRDYDGEARRQRELGAEFAEWLNGQLTPAEVEPEPAEPAGPQPDKHQASGGRSNLRPEGASYLDANHAQPGTAEHFAAELRNLFNGRRNDGGWKDV